MVSGFGGMRAVAGELTFDPRLPEDWDEITFRVQWRGSRLRIRVAQESMDLTAETGPASGTEPVTLIVRGEPVVVGPETTTVALDGQGERLDAVLSPGCQVGRARADGTVITASTPEEGAATTT